MPATSLPDVLVVDDDEDIRVSLDRGLRLSGFAVRTAADGEAALRGGRAERAPDCIVLDVGLPGVDGVAVVEALRARGRDRRRSACSARAPASTTGWPVSPPAPTTTWSSRSRWPSWWRGCGRCCGGCPADAATGLTVGPLAVDPRPPPVAVDGAPVELTRREFDLLEILARNAGIVLSRERLLELVWGYDFAVDTNVVDVFVS